MLHIVLTFVIAPLFVIIFATNDVLAVLAVGLFGWLVILGVLLGMLLYRLRNAKRSDTPHQSTSLSNPLIWNPDSEKSSQEPELGTEFPGLDLDSPSPEWVQKAIERWRDRGFGGGPTR